MKRAPRYIHMWKKASTKQYLHYCLHLHKRHHRNIYVHVWLCVGQGLGGGTEAQVTSVGIVYVEKQRPVRRLWHPGGPLFCFLYTFVLFESFTVRILFHITYAIKCEYKKKENHFQMSSTCIVCPTGTHFCLWPHDLHLNQVLEFLHVPQYPLTLPMEGLSFKICFVLLWKPI